MGSLHRLVFDFLNGSSAIRKLDRTNRQTALAERWRELCGRRARRESLEQKEKREAIMNCKTQVRGGVMLRNCSILCLVAVCGFLLLNTPAVAQVHDQCYGALPLTNPVSGPVTGCGAVINVFAVDGSGNATSFSVVPNNSTHNPYDNDDDTLIGIQNQSGANLSSITLSSNDTTAGGIFAFEMPAPGDGPCFSNHLLVCGPTGYEGPNNTFESINSVPCGDSTCHTTGTVRFTTAIPNGGSTWFALEGTPDSISNAHTVILPLTGGSTEFNYSVFTGAPTKQTIDFTGVSPSPTDNTTVMQNTFLPITDAQYQNLVANTFAQGSFCMQQQVGLDSGAHPIFSCAVNIQLCTNSSNSTPAGLNCTTTGTTGTIHVTSKYFTSQFGNPEEVPFPGFIAAKDDALNCNGATDLDNSCRGIQSFIAPTIQNDCCTTSGGTKSFNSLSVPAGCVGYALTSVDEHNVSGFAQPVDNPGSDPLTPIVNLINSKQAVPIKLSVAKNTFQSGSCTATAPVSNLDLVGSTSTGTVKAVVISATNVPSGVCKTGIADATPSTLAAGSSGWQILGNGMYQYNWKPAAPVGSCIQFSVSLGDGVQHSAYFQVTK